MGAGACTALIGAGMPVRASAPGQVVAPRDNLAAPWSSVQFNYNRPGGAAPVPGILVALPDGSLYAASRVCPHMGCTLVYYRIVQDVNDTYGVNLSNPALACPCHMSVFDLAKDGRVAAGPAQRPPFRFRVVLEADQIVVEGLEGAT